MPIMTIDGRKVAFTDEQNVLSVVRKAGINIPTLCYQPELSIYGACRLCTVEDDKGKTFASCSERPRDGMVIYTNTARLRLYRKLIVELLLGSHCRTSCTTCRENGECKLQELTHKLGIRNIRFENYKPEYELDTSSPAIARDPNKCILCGNCVRACEELQGIGVLGFAHRGTDAIVIPAFNKPLAETQCVNCGQCRVYCPTGAITLWSNKTAVWARLADPGTRVVAQVAPAVRVAIGERFGLPKGKSVIGRIVNALHKMGFDEVYDTTFGADLTIMEETREFLDRLDNGGTLPLFTSCCPAWVKLLTDQYKDLIPHISTCRSPQGMLSAVIKEYYRDPAHNDGRKTVMVSIMPCAAKKAEALRPNSKTKGEQDTDIVITTSELLQMIEEYGLDLSTLDTEACDMPFGFGSGGGVIFGVTGGVTEAVLRRLSPSHSGGALQLIAQSGVRGYAGVKEFTVPYKDTEIRIAVVSGLANARKVLERIRKGEAEYHLVEVMACTGGCVMGGGQPTYGRRSGTQAARTEGIYAADSSAIVKKSDENPLIVNLYRSFLKGRTHELLHNQFY